MKNLVESWKTTMVGLIVILAAIISVFTISTINWIDASVPLTIGIALMFSPDTMIDKISKVFTKKI